MLEEFTYQTSVVNYDNIEEQSIKILHIEPEESNDSQTIDEVMTGTASKPVKIVEENDQVSFIWIEILDLAQRLKWKKKFKLIKIKIIKV